jgi:hypothetical protein
MAISRMQQPRQMYQEGGIMPRQMYGLGSLVKSSWSKWLKVLLNLI